MSHLQIKARVYLLDWLCSEEAAIEIRFEEIAYIRPGREHTGFILEALVYRIIVVLVLEQSHTSGGINIGINGAK